MGDAFGEVTWRVIDTYEFVDADTCRALDLRALFAVESFRLANKIESALSVRPSEITGLEKEPPRRKRRGLSLLRPVPSLSGSFFKLLHNLF